MSKQENSLNAVTPNAATPRSVIDGNVNPSSSGHQVRPSESCLSCNTHGGTKRRHPRPGEPEVLEDYDDIVEEFDSPVSPRKIIKPSGNMDDVGCDSDSVEDECTDLTELVIHVYESDTLLQPGRSFLVKDTVSNRSPPTSDTSQEERTAHTNRKSVENCDLSKIFKLSPNLSEAKKQETVTNGECEESEITVILRAGADNSTQVQDTRQDVLKVKEMFPSMEEDKIKKLFDEYMLKTEFLEIDGVSVVERVIEEMLAFQESEEKTASEDVQSALCDLRPSLRNQDSDAYKSQSADLRKKCVPGRKWRKGAFVTSKKGKAPARKPDSQQTSSCNSDENVMEFDGCDSASSSSLYFPQEASMDTPSVDHNANGCKEMEFPLLKCDACGATQDTAAASQCCMDHLICKACVEKQAKKVISPESKETQIPCPMFGCTTYIPKSQASKVLPSLIMELLEEKINKRAMESITKMKDLHCCPFCDFLVCMEYDRKEFFCPNTECMKLSCRYCKKDLANDRSISHDNCTYFMTLLEESKDHLELPKYWHPMPSEQKDFILVNLYQSGREFKMIRNLFCHSLKSDYPITIYRIQNPRLWQKFGLTRKHMAEEFGENLVNEQQLFHGTQTDAIGTICRDGLDWRMCGENGVAFGQGTYFAKDALYSNRYSLPHRNPERWSRAVHLPANNALSGGITFTLQCSVGSSGIPNNFKISSSPSMSVPQDPNQVNALQGIGAHAGGFGTITYGTPFGIAPQEPPTSNKPTPQGAPENSSSPGTSVTQNVTSKPLAVTSDVTQIMREGRRYMFVARVLVGRSGQGSHGMRKPQQDIKDPKGRAFNSCVNFVDKPSIFVIFDSSQCYPEYLIEYSHPKVPKSRR